MVQYSFIWNVKQLSELTEKYLLLCTLNFVYFWIHLYFYSFSGGELNYILIFPVLSMSKWMLPVLLWSVLLTLRFAIAEALQISDFMTAQWRTSSKGKRHLGELDDDLARFLEFLRRNFGTGKRLQSDGKEEVEKGKFMHGVLSMY